ncbi:MAG: response regulator [Ignavibacteriaceae bacterium]|jgi:signal transduction histidine kinase/DNA-binding response OmpR family regulator/methyl-accepting chemotaxis protein
MKIKHLKISTQLKFGFASIMFFVLIFGIVTYLQSNELHLQMDTLHDHPLMVRRAIDQIRIDILSMRLATRDLMLAKNYTEKQNAIQTMELSAADALKQFDVLNERYLGPRDDLDEAFKAYMKWKTARDVNTQLALAGENEKVKESVSVEGDVGKRREQLLIKIQKIDTYAKNKAEALTAASGILNSSLEKRLISLAIVILSLSLLISYVIIRNIKTPLAELNRVTHRFRDNDMEARSIYLLHNEFGVLSSSFNELAETIQTKIELDNRGAELAQVMLNEYDTQQFFKSMLNALAMHTGSQMAAVYLLSKDKKLFEHFESIGLASNAKQSFSADNLEGEFGSSLASHKVQQIKNISDDTQFIFHTVSGAFIPREIITIPVLDGDDVTAMISLASIKKYDVTSVQFIMNILGTLNARVGGILAYRKIKEFSEKLESQNRELEVQKTELSAQASELTEQNTELEMQKKQLDEASRLKTNFLSTMSHELRTPLNSVIALSGVLNRRLSNKIGEEEYSYLEVIERNGKNLLALINDILDISRIEAGREEIEITKFNANSLVSEVISMIHPQAKQKNIELLQINSEPDLVFFSDADKCRHILQNLIGNAVKFTENGKVEIATLRNEKGIEITVTDTGIGIAENHLPHIFDEFRQADGSTSRRFGGTGLGLAIAKKYASLLGGTITVKSIPDEGSEFKLILPSLHFTEKGIFDKEPPILVKHKNVQTSKQPDSGALLKTILLVEDSEPAIIQIKDFLEESGYKIIIAKGGEEALNILSTTIPDAIVLDLMMPGVDGFQVLKSLRESEQTTHIPVLILTAKHITKEDLQYLRGNNTLHLIQKGDINRNELKNALSSMVFPEALEEVKTEKELQIITGDPVVLVVEDNLDNMITIKAMLSRNYTVLEATCGNECIEMVKKHDINLILMDIALPGLDGLEAFKMIRELPAKKDIPVIAITANAMTNDREKILAYGFDAYIAKPLDDNVFFKTLNETLYGK